MGKRKMKLSYRLFAGITLLSLFGLAVLFAIIVTFIRGMVVEQVREKYESDNMVMAARLDSWLDEFLLLLDGMAFAVPNVRREHMFGIVRDFQAGHPDINLAFVGFPDGYAIASHGDPPADGWYSYARPWYAVAMENMGASAIMPTPEWSITGQAWAIFGGRRLPSVDGAEYGVVGFVMYIDRILEYMRSVEIYGDGYAALVGRGGEIIFHPDPGLAPTDRLSFMGDSPLYGPLHGRALAGETFIPFTDESGTDFYVLAAGLSGTDWLMLSVIPASAINASINTIVAMIMLTTFGVLIVLTVFVMLAVSKLMRGGIGAMFSEFQETSLALARGESVRFDGPRDDSFGLDKMKGEFERNLGIVSDILQDMDKLSLEFVRHGDIEYRIDTSKYAGAYREMMQKTNGLIDSQASDVLPMIQAVDKLAGGDFDVTINDLPGKKMILPRSIRSIAATLNGLYESVSALAEHAAAGELGARIDSGRFSGKWAVLSDKLNNLMTAVAEPLDDIGRNVAIMSQGDFSHLDGTYPGTYGAIQKACNSVNDTLQAVVREISVTLQKIADGDLRVSLKEKYAGSYAPIEASINTILDNLNSTLSEVKVSVEHVAEGAGQIARSATTLADATMKQSGTLEELSTSVATIHEKALKASADAKAASLSSDRIQRHVAEGGEVIGSMEGTMGKIKSSSEDISKIIGVISSIAFQTNLLALNASVEAARAGEHGMGFSVVADEVRNLAARSQQSTADTSAIIKEDLERVDEGLQATGGVVAAFDVIAANVREISGHIATIAEVSAEQLASISGINAGVSELTGAVAEISVSAEESAAASEELNSQAELLREKFAFFRLKA